MNTKPILVLSISAGVIGLIGIVVIIILCTPKKGKYCSDALSLPYGLKTSSRAFNQGWKKIVKLIINITQVYDFEMNGYELTISRRGYNETLTEYLPAEFTSIKVDGNLIMGITKNGELWWKKTMTDKWDGDSYQYTTISQRPGTRIGWSRRFYTFPVAEYIVGWLNWKLPDGYVAWSASSLSGYVNNFTDSKGKTHSGPIIYAVTVYALMNDKILFYDPWYPFGALTLGLPENTKFDNIDSSGSTSNRFNVYSYVEKKVMLVRQNPPAIYTIHVDVNTRIVAPDPKWQPHPIPEGIIIDTSNPTIIQTGRGNTGRELRIGAIMNQTNGYCRKFISGDTWTFVST